MQGRRGARGARRAGLFAGSLAAAAVATVVTGPPASAEVLSKDRTDPFTFTDSASGALVSCFITSTLEYDTATQRFTASTSIAGPERPECRGSWPEVTVTTADGTHHAQGFGGVVNLSYGPVSSSLTSHHATYFQSCSCFSPTVTQTLPK
jgi:hypothetical protein